jgi:O-antigen ligase
VAAQWTAGLMAAGFAVSLLAGGTFSPDLSFLPFLAVLLLSSLFSPLSQVPLALQTAGFVLLAWLSTGLDLDQALLKRLARLWLAGAALVSLYALAQKAGFDPVPAFRQAHSQDRAMATFGNANFLAAFLVAAWPLTFFLAPGMGVNALRLLFLAALACTGSRAGFLAVLFQVLLVPSRDLGRKWLALPVLAAAAAVFHQWMRPTLRLEVWKDSLRLWLAHPLLGWGPGSYPLAMQQAVTANLGGKLAAGNQFVEHPHNFVLLLLCELGLLGLAAFAWTLFSAFRPLSLSAAGTPAKRILMVSVAGLIFENLFDRNLVLAGSAFFFWTLLGIQAGSQPHPRRAAMPAWGAMTLGMALMGLAGYFGWTGWRSVNSYGQATAGDFMQTDAAAARAQEAEARVKLGFDTSDPMKWQSLGEGLAKQGEYAKAGEAYHEALKRDPALVSAAVNWGNCLFQQQKFQEAESAYRHALAVDPASVDAHFNLGYCLFYQRRLKEAVDEFDTVLRLHPGDAKALKMKEQILQ